MPLPITYIAVAMIWATIPLAMKWSTEEVGFLFGISSRTLLGVCFALLISRSLGIALPLHRKAILPYLAGGNGIFTAMLFTYCSIKSELKVPE